MTANGAPPFGAAYDAAVADLERANAPIHDTDPAAPPADEDEDRCP